MNSCRNKRQAYLSLDREDPLSMQTVSMVTENMNNKLAKLGDAIASHLKPSLTDPPTDT